MLVTEEQASRILSHEVTLRTSRSGGKGGQNVNKVESRVELSFRVGLSEALDPDQKAMILSRLEAGNDGVLTVSSSVHRSQHENREEAGKKLIRKLNSMLHRPKQRKPTRPSRASKEKKLKEKKRVSEKKASRRGDF